MSEKRKILLMFAKGGASQSEVAAALRVSKRDVSACARAIRERRLTFDAISGMSAAEIDAMFAPPGGAGSTRRRSRSTYASRSAPTSRSTG